MNERDDVSVEPPKKPTAASERGGELRETDPGRVLGKDRDPSLNKAIRVLKAIVEIAMAFWYKRNR